MQDVKSDQPKSIKVGDYAIKQKGPFGFWFIEGKGIDSSYGAFTSPEKAEASLNQVLLKKDKKPSA